ncbi:MAG: tetratricopeptide repeat protein [Deltaproteobacteria bacterium]|nr:tetratricopeptide repeat protein [Deltaproteobacteria bacterium]
MRHIQFILFITIAFLVVSPAIADSTAAKEAFAKGTALFEDEDYIGAADAFRIAYELEPSWKILYNIGQCEAAARRYGQAMDAFEKYLSLGGDDVAQRRRDEVEAELDRLKRLVGFVEILAPDGAVAFIDDQRRGEAPFAGKLMIDASVEHDLKIVLDDETLLSRKVKVSGAQSITVDVRDAKKGDVKITQQEDHLQPLPNEMPIAPPNQHHSLKVAGIITAGIGGALLVTGAITGALAVGKSNELADTCADKSNCDKSNEPLKTSGEKLHTATVALVVSGAVLAAGGATLLIVAHKKKRNERLQASPWMSPHLSGIVILGKF